MSWRGELDDDKVLPTHVGKPQGDTGWCDAPDCWCCYVKVPPVWKKHNQPPQIEPAEPAPQYRRTEKCDRLRHSMGYMLCPGCEPVPAEPTGTSEPEEDAPDKLKRKIKTLEGNLRDLNTLYFKSLDNYNSMEDWWHKEWHQSQGIPCANDEYCPLTRRVNLPALLSTMI